jgi:hypothetical protein
MTAGLLNKAKRGELALQLPIGLVRNVQNIVLKNPHKEVQQRLEMIFSTFLRLKSACKVLQYFNEQKLRIPRRNHYGDLVWKTPTIAAIISTLKNPAYTGTFVYGRTRSLPQKNTSGKKAQKHLPIEQWKIIVKDKYPAYISWETFETIQAMLKDNYLEYDRNKSRGVPREGSALLHGILYCGECGHKMVVQYKQGTRYICNSLRQQYRVPVCQNIPADPVDTYVVKAFFEAISPIELDAYSQALEKQNQIEEEVDKTNRQQIQRLSYQATLAQRQYDQVDPDNRLVASELERRWESALRELKQAKEFYETKKNQQKKAVPFPQKLKESFEAIGQKLPDIWNTSVLSNVRKKALLRCLIDKVVIHRNVRDQVHTKIVWKGGATTTIQFPIQVGSFADLSSAKEMEEDILKLVSQGFSDTDIAKKLTDSGYRSPMRKHVLTSTVQNIRLKHRVLHTPSQSHPRRIPGYLTIPQTAKQLGVSNYWIHDRINNGCIQIVKEQKTKIYLFPDKPETIELLLKLKNGQINKVQF